MTVHKRSVKKKAPEKKSPKARRPHRVAVDESQTIDAPPALGSGFDRQGLGEELAETFVENVTGADDAATDHRAEVTADERRVPFVLSAGTDASSPARDLGKAALIRRSARPTVRTP